MSLNILFSAAPGRWREYRKPLENALCDAGVEACIGPDISADDVDYIVYAPNGPVTDFSVYPRLKAVLGLWAGVEKIVGNPTLRVPMTRMVDAGLREGMVEYVCGHVLRHHLGTDDYVVNPSHEWKPVIPPLARDRSVAILGLGALGTACARALSQLNFRVSGWSRRRRNIDGVTCHAGENGLECILETAEIVVLLLPLTKQTENILDRANLEKLPEGAVIINPGRGALIDDDALLAALDSGRLGHATLDVFRTEPLPPNHPFWGHEKITITPHIASETRPETAALVIAENVRRNEAGEPMAHLVDRSAGY